MKRLTFTFFLGLVTGVATMNAQVVTINMGGGESKKSPIDKVLFIAQYEMAFIQDTSHLDQIKEETMILKVGEKCAHFYSYTKFVTDSLLQAELAKVVAQSGGGSFSFSQQGGSNPGMITYQIYKNYPAGKVTTLEQLGGRNLFRCEETNECPEWQILSDTATILSHLCYKATCRFKGRDYTAWFAPTIPRGEGPWKLCGLPGLILHAEDSRKHYVFECTGLKNVQGDEILYGDDNYEPVSRSTLNKTYERAAADPIGFMTASMPNAQVRVMTADGEAVNANSLNNRPYNPIELSEQ